ncbi:acetate--CoA ligase family protein [Halorarius litoreus]|uniref:acetate--CoA ligase family protein n=1 Tax=Halorarius litoreus TaxID=2962676 RepID=UPI0020CD36FE|nr:acetate--CoA ligase family protein [Halorarius litoreus]
MNQLFTPNSIALVGASADSEKLSGRPYRYLRKHGYEGDIYLVNPSHDTIDGQPCYDSVGELPAGVDLAMALVPARLTPQVATDCGDAGIPYVLVIASGFSETEDGEALEAELLDAAHEAGVRLVGPNSEGLVNVPDKVGASFSSILKRDALVPGGLSFVTQSGAFGGALFQLTQDRGIGGNTWLSTGNEADLTTVDFLRYLVEDPDTDVVVSYVESLTRGAELLDVGRRAAETDTDLVAIRVGESPAGRQAAASHTGSIASDDAVYDAVFAQAGITSVWGVDEYVDTVTALSTVPSTAYPDVDADAGRGIGVLSVSGGAAVLIADTCHRLGLPLASFAPETVAAIEAEIPAYGSATNPVDVTGGIISQPELFERCMRSVVRDDAVEAVVLQFGNSGGETIETCKAELLDIQATYDVPLAVVFTGGQPAPETADELRDAGVLLFEDPVRAVRTLEMLADRRRARERAARLPDRGDISTRRPLPDGGSWQTVTDALAEQGLAFARTRSVDSADAAVAAADQLGYPVAMKLNPLAVEHKSEVGGVRVGLADAAAVRDAYDALATVADDGPVLVQEQVDGVEAIVGVVDDPDFGPVMLVGPGGVFVELFDDFAYRALPVTEAMAREMLNETVLGELLDGYRGAAPGDVDALVSFLVAVSDAYETFDLAELECNPVVVTSDDAVAVDLLVR